jgi:hypothetical protein
MGDEALPDNLTEEQLVAAIRARRWERLKIAQSMNYHLRRAVPLSVAATPVQAPEQPARKYRTFDREFKFKIARLV